MPVTKKAPGRPRIYATSADRVRAFRARIRHDLDAYNAAFRTWRQNRRTIYESEWEQALAMIETYLTSLDHPAGPLILEGLHSSLYFTNEKYYNLRLKQDWNSRPLPPGHLIKYL